MKVYLYAALFKAVIDKLIVFRAKATKALLYYMITIKVQRHRN